MSWYLISRPGRPLHLTFWVNSGESTGSYVPLCNQNYGRKWRLTGPLAEKWEQHSQAGFCSRCEEALDKLNADWAHGDQS